MSNSTRWLAIFKSVISCLWARVWSSSETLMLLTSVSKGRETQAEVSRSWLPVTRRRISKRHSSEGESSDSYGSCLTFLLTLTQSQTPRNLHFRTQYKVQLHKNNGNVILLTPQVSYLDGLPRNYTRMNSRRSDRSPRNQ
jgi:hypothetical protein